MSVITKLYDNYPQASQAAAAVNRLNMQGVEASILGGEQLSGEYDRVSYRDGIADPVTDSDATATGAGVGAVVGGGAGLLAGLGILAIPGIGPLVAAGWLAAAAVGAAGGAVAGGALGAVVDLGIPEKDLPVYSESFRRGAVAVTVRFPEDARISVESALAQMSSIDVNNLRDRYESEGWRANEIEDDERSRLDKNLPPAGML